MLICWLMQLSCVETAWRSLVSSVATCCEPDCAAEPNGDITMPVSPDATELGRPATCSNPLVAIAPKFSTVVVEGVPDETLLLGIVEVHSAVAEAPPGALL